VAEAAETAKDLEAVETAAAGTEAGMVEVAADTAAAAVEAGWAVVPERNSSAAV
jgi:hypothetical protein